MGSIGVTWFFPKEAELPGPRGTQHVGIVYCLWRRIELQGYGMVLHLPTQPTDQG